MKYKTKRQAAYAWVESFDAIPTNMFKDYANAYCEDVSEIVEMRDLDSGEDEICEVEAYGFPMWGTMWSFHERTDEDWLEGGWGYYGEKEGIKKMLELGFNVYRSEEYGYFFGIDGAGFDFYEAYWIPLYDARGMHWHKEEEE